MYLKSIEIQGFKSFANKILFTFHNGITGIVGPNGSGKSNVADAVRWVLGEQRVKQLRGGSMQDVIFAGTETRKPQGFAYVAITLDNADHALPVDYEEVTVSRRLYRSGESEYLLNGTSCRLKDIHELFYDTGIGKEGYSIIGQGQIDKILSGRPEERRELFDEAAGIVKFKRRKAAAQKSLEDESQNLLRVADILAELEKQVGPLKRQSETAKEYLRLREELKKKDANLFLLEMESGKKQLTEIEAKEGLAAADLEERRKKQEALKQQYEEFGSQLEALEAQLLESRQTMQNCELKKNHLQGQINVLKEQIHTEQLQEEHIKERLAAIQKEIAEKEAQKQDFWEQNGSTKEKEQQAEEKLSQVEGELLEHENEHSRLEGLVEQDKSGMMELLNHRAQLAARQQRYEAMLEQVQVRRSEVSQKLLRFKTDEVNQDLQMQEQQKKLDAIEADRKELLEQRKGIETILGELAEERKNQNQALMEGQQEYHRRSTRLESLQNLAERYEGYGNSTRRVMEAKERMRGIHGVVADLISCEKRYETAIETALGGSIQNIVTDTEDTAKQLIAYLKKNKYGRATFLPLTSIGNKNTFQQTAALKEEGVLGLAHSLVQAKPEYEGLLKYLLGRVLVVDTIDHAIALARKFQYTLRIVTLEGELLSAGGSMTGGAFKNNSNLLGRRREIEELKKQCEQSLAETGRLQKELALSEELLEVQREELLEVQKREQEVQLRQNTAELELAQFRHKKEEIQENSSDLVRENRQLEEQIAEIKKNREQLGGQIQELDERNQHLQKEIVLFQEQLEEEKKQRERLLKEVSAAQIAVSEQKQSLRFAEENVQRLVAEQKKLQEEEEALSQGGNDTQSIIQKKEEQIEELLEQIAREEEARGQQEEKLSKQEEEKNRVSRSQKTIFGEQDALTEQVQGLDREVYRLETQREKAAEKLESLSSYMWKEYELTIQTAEALIQSEWDNPSKLRSETEGLKEAIRKLGAVNVNAISDYTELSGRYEFMKTQHDDLVAAKEALLKIIDELDTGMRRQFEEKFGEIRREFDRVFKEMFGGGHGELELMEGDLLETGIQIISQPPGKKLQNMMQLSGGEKALTAIALLFAIQNLKPSPFCLLDEIEAALDDSNVDRFAGYLHKLTDHTQFIVITHRRGTMVAADRLYGITMQEKGVSALVSVSLIEDELEAEKIG